MNRSVLLVWLMVGFACGAAGGPTVPLPHGGAANPSYFGLGLIAALPAGLLLGWRFVPLRRYDVLGSHAGTWAVAYYLGVCAVTTVSMGLFFGAVAAIFGSLLVLLVFVLCLAGLWIGQRLPGHLESPSIDP